MPIRPLDHVTSLDQVMDDTQVAEKFNVTPKTVRAWIRSGKLAGYVIGRKLYTTEAAVIDMLATSRLRR